MGDEAPPADGAQEDKKKKKKFAIPAIHLKEGQKPGGKVGETKEAPAAQGGGAPVIPTHETDVKINNLDIIKELGRGATGVVELVQDKETKRKYAMKTLNFPPALSECDQKTIERETRRLKELDCPYLVKTHAADFTGRQMHVVMELMDGGALDSILGDSRAFEIPVPDMVVAGVIHGLVHGLAFMHQRKDAGRQIHRDIKPGNTLLNMQGHCKIADFGTAKDSSTQKQHTMIGTMAYMAPERIQGMPYGPPADMWSVGVTVSEMALGRYPFKPSGPGPLGFLNAVMGFSFDDLQLGDHDQHMQSFVRGLLKQKPQERLTAQEAVDHPFLKGEDRPVETLYAEVAKWLQQIKDEEEKRKAALRK